MSLFDNLMGLRRNDREEVVAAQLRESCDPLGRRPSDAESYHEGMAARQQEALAFQSEMMRNGYAPALEPAKPPKPSEPKRRRVLRDYERGRIVRVRRG